MTVHNTRAQDLAYLKWVHPSLMLQIPPDPFKLKSKWLWWKGSIDMSVLFWRLFFFSKWTKVNDEICAESLATIRYRMYIVWEKKKTGISAVWILVLHTWALSVQNCVHSNYFVHVQWKKKLKNTWRPHHAPDLALTSGTKVLWVAKWGLHGG